MSRTSRTLPPSRKCATACWVIRHRQVRSLKFPGSRLPSISWRSAAPRLFRATCKEGQYLKSLELIKSALAAKRLLVIGGLNVDQHLRVEEQPVDDGSARISEYEVGFGGHAGNCAVQLARLGVNVFVLGAVGDDADGAALLADLEYSCVDTSLVSRLAGHHTGRVVIPSFPDRRYM